ncbi:hypothetical protein Avbf_03731 [Armadillidium vulgare]|nr:hypothetical protein Avbf_03731 [Armadillidium vulgare]
MVLDNNIECKKEADEKECPKKKRRYSQKYSSSWEHLELYSGWLRKSTCGVHYVYCSVCSTNLSLKGGITDLRKHARSQKHIKKSSEVVENLKQGVSISNNISSSCRSFESKFEDDQRVNSNPETNIENSSNDHSYQGDEVGTEAEISTQFILPKLLNPNKNSSPPVSVNHEEVIVSSSVSDDISFTEDEFESFGKFVTSQLRKFPEKMAVEMTLEIHSLITRKRLTLIKEQNSQSTPIANSQLITVSIPKDYSSNFTVSNQTNNS